VAVALGDTCCVSARVFYPARGSFAVTGVGGLRVFLVCTWLSIRTRGNE
jgi:hypothetical protein